MSHSNPDGRCRRMLLRGLLATGALFCVSGTHVANSAQEEIRVQSANGANFNFNTGTMALRDMELRQGAGTFIRAKETTAVGITQNYDNATWTLKGVVHIEHEGAVLDAENAIAVFAGGQLKSIDVKGSPAQFTHQLKNAERRSMGRARNIQYDTAAGRVAFAGETWYSNGLHEASGNTFVYDTRDGSVSAPDRSNFILRPSQRVPTPRTPDRATAK